MILRKTSADTIMLSVGAVGYSTIELLWRGRTHWSMMLAGGICFLSFAHIGRIFKNSNLFYKCLLGSAIVTAIELLFGLLFNKALGLSVWDYSELPFNFLGQICLLYSVLWGLLCIPCIPLAYKLYNNLLGN